MLLLKRHYEYWFAALALHKLGAVMIPATHMLTVKDLVYRITSAEVKAIVCTLQNETPEKVREAVKEAGMPVKLWCVQKEAEGFADMTAEMEAAEEELERIKTLATDPMMLYFTSRNDRKSERGHPRPYLSAGTYRYGEILAAGGGRRTAFYCCRDGMGKSLLGKDVRAVAGRKRRYGL